MSSYACIERLQSDFRAIDGYSGCFSFFEHAGILGVELCVVEHALRLFEDDIVCLLQVLLARSDGVVVVGVFRVLVLYYNSLE